MNLCNFTEWSLGSCSINYEPGIEFHNLLANKGLPRGPLLTEMWWQSWIILSPWSFPGQPESTVCVQREKKSTQLLWQLLAYKQIKLKATCFLGTPASVASVIWVVLSPAYCRSPWFCCFCWGFGEEDGRGGHSQGWEGPQNSFPLWPLMALSKADPWHRAFRTAYTSYRTQLFLRCPGLCSPVVISGTLIAFLSPIFDQLRCLLAFLSMHHGWGESWTKLLPKVGDDHCPGLSGPWHTKNLSGVGFILSIHPTGIHWAPALHWSLF